MGCIFAGAENLRHGRREGSFTPRRANQTLRDISLNCKYMIVRICQRERHPVSQVESPQRLEGYMLLVDRGREQLQQPMAQPSAGPHHWS
jgi:hypothetical protein